jgi:hypothetical protein
MSGGLCRKPLLGGLFKKHACGGGVLFGHCHKGCGCESACGGCGECGGCCGAAPASPAPAAAGEGAPMPPPPMADPSASYKPRRGMVQASRTVVRN